MPTKQPIKMSAGRDADKYIYLYKRIQHDPINQKMRVLGLQGATSGTNTKTLQSTATKTVTLKGVGATNQQRVVDVIFQTATKGVLDLYWDLYAAWKNGELVGLWRVDLNTVLGKKPARTVETEYSQCYVPQLPTTEALGGTLTSNITFEVNGEANSLNSDEKAFVLHETDLPDGFLDTVGKFVNFSNGTDIGVDEDGEFTDNTVDDDTIEVRDTTTQENVQKGDDGNYKSVDQTVQSTTDATTPPIQPTQPINDTAINP